VAHISAGVPGCCFCTALHGEAGAAVLVAVVQYIAPKLFFHDVYGIEDSHMKDLCYNIPNWIVCFTTNAALTPA
jgi:hypothetical protein